MSIKTSILLVVIILCSSTVAQNYRKHTINKEIKNSFDNDENSKGARQLDIDDLLKSLNDAIIESESSEKFVKREQEHSKGITINKNSHVQTTLNHIEKDKTNQDENKFAIPLNSKITRKTDDMIVKDVFLDELLKQSEDTTGRQVPTKKAEKTTKDHLTEEQKQKQYLISFLRLQKLMRNYNKKQQPQQMQTQILDDHRAQNIGNLNKQLNHLQTKLKPTFEGKREAPYSEDSKSDDYTYPEPRSSAKLDSIIDDAADIILRLSQETRAKGGDTLGRSPSDEAESEKKALGLAIELVGRVSLALIGSDTSEYPTPDAETYMRASSASDSEELEEPLLTSAGFDFTGQLDVNGYNEYLGHPSPYSRGRCDSCEDDDFNTESDCPLCKRNSHVFQGRDKRLAQNSEPATMYHLRKSKGRSNSGGVWHDVNKFYNFDDLEHDKFIDLSKNCTDGSTEPDCQRLQYQLVVPKDAEPVPLWFIRDHLSQGGDLARDMHERARGLQTGDGQHPAPHSPSMLHFLNNRVSDDAIELNEESQIVLFGTKVLQEKLLTEYKLTQNTFLEFLAHHGFRVTGSKICRSRSKRCNGASKFRSIEGSCNNFNHPSWGQSNTAFVRILPARYADGIHALSTSVSGSPLPNPRHLSSRLFSRRNASDASHTLALVHWGQLLAHDFARQVIDQTPDGGIECCESNGRGPLPKSLQHHSCSPIVIPETDNFYSRYNQTCMNFVRSMTVAREDCSLGPANQLNGVSSFLDLSPVYGSDHAISESLREKQGGRMRTEKRSSRVMMPTSAKSGFCDARTNYDVCYETGDVRTNQNPQLVILQTILIREHNRVAGELTGLNPHWNDERLFQESRRIVIAEYQHITYRHWLPLVLGKRYCVEHEIFPQHNGLSNDYDVRVNPGIINSFTSAAFRFLHSLIEGTINLVADNYGTSGTLRLSNHYFRPQIIEPNKNFESLLRGLVYQTMQKPDSNFHSEITEYLFRSDNEYGMDLEAIDIQRGRDHGLPGYNAYREICQLGRAKDFNGLINEISLRNVEKLQSIYEHVDDIDLLVGATMENRMSGSLLGPTLQCLIGEQFYRSRVGDKYFYNNANFHHSFTAEQFEEIKKASLATWICDLGESTYEVQLNPFKTASNKNPMMPCFNLPRINLELWKEEVQYRHDFRST